MEILLVGYLLTSVVFIIVSCICAGDLIDLLFDNIKVKHIIIGLIYLPSVIIVAVIIVFIIGIDYISTSNNKIYKFLNKDIIKYKNKE